MTQSFSPSPEELTLLRDVIGTFVRGGGRHPSSSPTLRWGVALRDGFHDIDCMLTCIHSHVMHALSRQLLPTALYMRSGDCPGPSRPEANPTRARDALFGAHAPPLGGHDLRGHRHQLLLIHTLSRLPPTVHAMTSCFLLL